MVGTPPPADNESGHAETSSTPEASNKRARMVSAEELDERASSSSMSQPPLTHLYPSLTAAPGDLSSFLPPTLSPASSDTMDIDVEPQKVQALFISSLVDFETRKIEFSVNGHTRPGTLLAQQGDHITSYILYVMAILSSADADLKGAFSSICAFAKKVLEDEPLDHFVDIELNNDDVNKYFLASKEREQVVGQIQETNKELAQKLNSNLKYAKRQYLANHLAKLATCLLEGLQQHKLTAVFSRGRKFRNSREGSNTRTAINGLIAFEQICRWCEEEPGFFDDKQLTRIKNGLKPKSADIEEADEEAYHLRAGINALSGKEGKNTDDGRRARSLLREFETYFATNPQQIKERLIDLRRELFDAAKLGNFIGYLYDFYHDITFDLDKMFPFGTRPAACKNLDKQEYWQARLEEEFPEHKTNINSDKITGTVVRDNPEILIATLQRHFKIMHAAFPFLCKSDYYSGIKNAFLGNVVLKAQRWDAVNIPRTSEPLNIDYLNKGLGGGADSPEEHKSNILDPS